MSTLYPRALPTSVRRNLHEIESGKTMLKDAIETLEERFLSVVSLSVLSRRHLLTLLVALSSSGAIAAHLLYKSKQFERQTKQLRSYGDNTASQKKNAKFSTKYVLHG